MLGYYIDNLASGKHIPPHRITFTLHAMHSKAKTGLLLSLLACRKRDNRFQLFC